MPKTAEFPPLAPNSVIDTIDTVENKCAVVWTDVKEGYKDFVRLDLTTEIGPYLLRLIALGEWVAKAQYIMDNCPEFNFGTNKLCRCGCVHKLNAECPACAANENVKLWLELKP